MVTFRDGTLENAGVCKSGEVAIRGQGLAVSICHAERNEASLVRLSCLIVSEAHPFFCFKPLNNILRTAQHDIISSQRQLSVSECV